MLQARDAYDIRIAETFYEERMRNARNLRVSSDVIVQATGLSEEEIKAL